MLVKIVIGSAMAFVIGLGIANIYVNYQYSLCNKRGHENCGIKE